MLREDMPIHQNILWDMYHPVGAEQRTCSQTRSQYGHHAALSLHNNKCVVKLLAPMTP